MIGQLVMFNTPTRCLDDFTSMDEMPGHSWVEAGNIGIVVSEYPAGLAEEWLYYEILIGDRVVFDVNSAHVNPV